MSDRNTDVSLRLKMAEYLRPFEKDVPAAWRVVTQSCTCYPGQCFSCGYCYIAKLNLALQGNPVLDNVWLVHGKYLGLHCHAWVELPGDVVFDGALQEFYSRPDYYREVYASPWYKYAPNAAILISVTLPMSSEGKIPYGNWHEYLKLPRPASETPSLIKYEQAKELIMTSGLMRRQWLCELGARIPNVGRSASEWAEHIARLPSHQFIVPELNYSRTATGRASAIAALFDANLNEQLVGCFREEVITTRLERCTAACSVGGYQFTELMRRRPG